MDQQDVILNFEALKQTIKHRFPHGNWVKNKSNHCLGRFEVQFPGEKNPEVFNVFSTGKTSFQGSTNNGATLREFFENLKVTDLLSTKEELFEAGSRLQGLEVERKHCYRHELPHATALLMKASLEDLWKEAFGNTGFNQQNMEAVIDNSALTKRDVGHFVRIRGYGNGVGHSRPWLAEMSDIIGVQATYEQLVTKLLDCRSQ